MSKDSFAIASKTLDENVKNWILEAATSGIHYQELMTLSSPKLRLDYITSLLTELHNENKIIFSNDDDELITTKSD